MNTPTQTSLGAATCSDAPRRRWFMLSLAFDDLRIIFTKEWREYAAASLRSHRMNLATTAIMLPSRTGGGDYSMKAVRAGISPMIFGGPRGMPGMYCDARRTLITRDIATAKGWAFQHGWRFAPRHVDVRGASLCTGMVPT